MELCDPRLAKRAKLVFPWETGFLSEIFGSKDALTEITSCDHLQPVWDVRWLRQISREPVDETVYVSAVTAGEKSTGSTSAFKKVGTKFTVIPWSDKLAEDRSVALERWRMIIDLSPQFSRVGRQLLACSDAPNPGEKAETVLKDTFEGKATSTLDSRSSAILAFARWRAATKVDWKIFPISEDACYDYLCEMRAAKKPPTFGRKFTEALGFCHGVLGLEGADECVASRRLSGASLSLLSRKEFDRQCDDLEVGHVMLLERASVELESGPDKTFAGFNIFKTHARCRHADTYHCAEEPILDVDVTGFGYLELSVTMTKTGKASSRASKKLPLVAHAIGISGLRWAEAYLKERALQGLSAEKGPLMPSVSCTGHWNAGRLSSGAANIWLRELILKLGGCLRPGIFVASHSCKHTFLAWLAKFGTPIGIRRILGGHLKPKEGSTIVYSRDALAGPLRQLQIMLESVRAKTFNPDATRSGRFTDIPDVPVEEVDVGVTLCPKPSPGEFLQPTAKRRLAPSPKEGVSVEEEVDGRKEFWDTGFLEVGSDTESWEVQDVSEQPGSSDDEGFPRGNQPERFVECRACGRTLSSQFDISECDTCGVEGCSGCLSFIRSDDHVSRCYHCHDQKRIEHEGASSSGSESDSSSSSESEDSESEAMINSEKVAAVLAKPGTKCRRPAKIEGRTLVQHKVLKTLHLGRFGSENLLSCGRNYSKATHDVLEHDPLFQWPRCKDCYGKTLDNEISSEVSVEP